MHSTLLSGVRANHELDVRVARLSPPGCRTHAATASLDSAIQRAQAFGQLDLGAPGIADASDGERAFAMAGLDELDATLRQAAASFGNLTNITAAEALLSLASSNSAVAFAICLIPALLTLAWSLWALRRSPEHQLAAVMGGTGVRLAVVGAATVLLHSRFEYLRQTPGFLTWVLVFYLFTLGLEIAVLLRAQPTAPAP